MSQPSRRAQSSGHAYLWSNSFHKGASLHGRLAHSRGTEDGHIKEGETAGVKATLWPEVKSVGSWMVGASESGGCSTGLSLHALFRIIDCFCEGLHWCRCVASDTLRMMKYDTGKPVWSTATDHCTKVYYDSRKDFLTPEITVWCWITLTMW